MGTSCTRAQSDRPGATMEQPWMLGDEHEERNMPAGSRTCRDSPLCMTACTVIFAAVFALSLTDLRGCKSTLKSIAQVVQGFPFVELGIDAAAIVFTLEVAEDEKRFD